jgi:hypothetical protein
VARRPAGPVSSTEDKTTPSQDQLPAHRCDEHTRDEHCILGDAHPGVEADDQRNEVDDGATAISTGDPPARRVRRRETNSGR